MIKPTWEELKEEDKDKFLIEIDPGVSFGTGKHETTQLCIRQLLKYIRGNAEYTPENKTPKVLDVGCGSGILSIVALKLGASEVVGTDLDPDCMTSTHENFEVNHLDSRLGTFYVGNLIDDVELQEKVGTEEYDIVVAKYSCRCHYSNGSGYSGARKRAVTLSLQVSLISRKIR